MGLTVLAEECPACGAWFDRPYRHALSLLLDMGFATCPVCRWSCSNSAVAVHCVHLRGADERFYRRFGPAGPKAPVDVRPLLEPLL